MDEHPPRCPFCDVTLDLPKDVGAQRVGLLGKATIIWCKRCGAILGGSQPSIQVRVGRRIDEIQAGTEIRSSFLRRLETARACDTKSLASPVDSPVRHLILTYLLETRHAYPRGLL